MQYLLLLLVLTTLSAQNLITKNYFVKAKASSPFIFSGFGVLFALLYFVATGIGRLNFGETDKILPYSLLFAVTYGLAVFTSKASIGCGPLSLSALFCSYSLMLPTFYGIFVTGDDVTLLKVLGITLLVISVILVNLKKEDSRITPKWVLLIILNIISNGICTIVQRVQQEDFSGEYKNEFMIIALAVVAFVMIISSVVLTKNRKAVLKDKALLKNSFLNGASNGFTNHMTMLLVAYLPSSVMYPTISAGSIIVSTVAAVFVYREKLSRMKIAGFVTGILSVILLNIR